VVSEADALVDSETLEPDEVSLLLAEAEVESVLEDEPLEDWSDFTACSVCSLATEPFLEERLSVL
jgi:hypothetical protein